MLGDAGERSDTEEHAEVPGSSEPSGQSQKSSLTCDRSRVIDGLDMQTNVVADVKYLATGDRNLA